ncbi:BglG family transcription antiterminator [Streptococcus porcinus]|uniref:PRD domain/PTS system IIA domain protein n=2 Tax=Streptococcus porcinus TaxID=1340 RepID=A0A4V0GZN0_STRPO|nr:PTS sugar transporter subunit IIA [Streptococcus porcinus]EGJ27545.1 PRD domain protein [Streptococcus porcinus str. Jelinkova 176]SQG43180.1 PRD domain/PTS system IIA domain protein [Streptococcus porcinus]VTT42224.1 PRD domain/PTS system IIA domain protein [Streptococcus porcinus]VTT43685.1 PRD domain/PTS system IIA domain protein [Streptococcus porcinus]
MNIRQISLLRDLIAQDQFVTAAYYAQMFNVSTKTIYKDINCLNHVLVQHQTVIERRPHFGIKLDISKNEGQRLLRSLQESRSQNQKAFRDSVDFRELELIKELGFGDCQIDILDFALDHFISEASAKRDLEKLLPLASHYGVSFQKKQGRISLEGKESEIRKFLRHTIVERVKKKDEELSFQNLVKVFNHYDVFLIEEQLTLFARRYHFEVSDIYKWYFILDACIANQRFRKGKLINRININDFTSVQDYEMYLLATEFLSAIFGLSHDILPQNEILAMMTSLIATGYIRDGHYLNETFDQVVSNLVGEVSRLINLDLSEDKHLKSMLLVHIQPMIYRLKNKVLISNQMTEVIKAQYSVLYHLVWLASKDISKRFNVHLNDAEISFLTIHFEVAIERKLKPLKIFVICPHHLATSELIMVQLRKIISPLDILQAIEISDLKKLKLSETDLVISSVDISDLKIPFIFVSSVITPQQLQLIQTQYANFSQGNSQMISYLQNNDMIIQSMIRHLLDDAVYLRKSFKSKTECIDYMVSFSERDNKENPNFKKSIIEREILGNTSVYTGIALPHANPEEVKKSQLVILTLDKPIKWGTNYIKVVMLIAIESSEVTLYRDALISIYAKIDSKAYIDALWNAESQSSLVKALFKDVTY